MAGVAEVTMDIQTILATVVLGLLAVGLSAYFEEKLNNKPKKK